MSGQLGYGQPMGGIAQTAFIVPDLQLAIRRWIADMRAGPFFVLPNFLVPGQTYRGEESRADITIAMGFAGHMLIELIQPLDDEPSVYKETIELRGYGFHHLGIACADVDADSREYQARGYHEAFRAAVPTGGEVLPRGPFGFAAIGGALQLGGHPSLHTFRPARPELVEGPLFLLEPR